MKLDLTNDIFNNLKENKFVQDFINELSRKLENNIKNNEIPIIEEVISKNNLTTGNRNSIMWNKNDIILKYANQNFNGSAMLFVNDNKKKFWSNNKEYYNNDVYSVLKIENKKIEEIEISKEKMPKNIKVNDVFQIENNNYIIKSNATNEIKEEILNRANKIIDKQNINLNGHRKEGHLYLVTEEVSNNRFLCDLTEASKVAFEEVIIPKELLEKATEGVVLKYTNGNYEYYSDDGFEMAEKMTR